MSQVYEIKSIRELRALARDLFFSKKDRKVIIEVEKLIKRLEEGEICLKEFYYDLKEIYLDNFYEISPELSDTLEDILTEVGEKVGLRFIPLRTQKINLRFYMRHGCVSERSKRKEVKKKVKKTAVALIAFLLLSFYGWCWFKQFYCDTRKVRELIYIQINDFRKNSGLNELKIDKELEESAQEWAEILIETNKFEHGSSGGWQGEVLAEVDEYVSVYFLFFIPIPFPAVAVENRLAEELFSAWVTSPLHFLVLNHSDWEKMGVGVAFKSSWTGYRIVAVARFSRG